MAVIDPEGTNEPHNTEDESDAVDRPTPRGKAAERARLLGGLQGSLPAEGLIAKGQTIVHHEMEPSPVVGPTAQSRLFAEIVARPLDLSRQIAEEAKERLSTRVTWWLVYAGLFAVVALPLGLGRSLLWWVTQPSPATVDLYEAVEALPTGSAVLLAFDYDPATRGEMDIVAQAVARHLMDRQTRIVAVSLLPAGPATAQGVLDALARSRPGYRGGYGRAYANLGFVPGEAAAVRLLGRSTYAAVARDFQNVALPDLEIMDGLSSLRSFDLVVEFGTRQDTLRWWIEQAATPLELPLGAAVSAAAGPQAQPYYQTEPRQLVGLLAGVQEAIMYESRYKGEPWVTGYNAARLDAQYWGHIYLVALILTGAAVLLVRRLRRGRAR